MIRRPPRSTLFPLHDALPIFRSLSATSASAGQRPVDDIASLALRFDDGSIATINYLDRKSTRLNSSHLVMSYAVFCLTKKPHRCYSSSHHVSSLFVSRRLLPR